MHFIHNLIPLFLYRLPSARFGKSLLYITSLKKLRKTFCSLFDLALEFALLAPLRAIKLLICRLCLSDRQPLQQVYHVSMYKAIPPQLGAGITLRKNCLYRGKEKQMIPEV